MSQPMKCPSMPQSQAGVWARCVCRSRGRPPPPPCSLRSAFSPLPAALGLFAGVWAWLKCGRGVSAVVAPTPIVRCARPLSPSPLRLASSLACDFFGAWAWDSLLAAQKSKTAGATGCLSNAEGVVVTGFASCVSGIHLKKGAIWFEVRD